MRLSKQALARQRLAQINFWLMQLGFQPIWTTQDLREQE